MYNETMMNTHEIWERRRARWNGWKKEQAMIAEAKANGLAHKLDVCDGCGRVCPINTNGLSSVCYDCRRHEDNDNE